MLDNFKLLHPLNLIRSIFNYNNMMINIPLQFILCVTKIITDTVDTAYKTQGYNVQSLNRLKVV
jgi:hypothetical protein